MNKLMKTMIVSIFILLLIAVGGFIYIFKYLNADDDGEQSIKQMNQLSYETPEITTDLKSGKFVRVKFRVITSSKAALKEIEKRDFQIKNILIKELSVMEEADFKENLDRLEKTLKAELNELMEDGEITAVYTVEKILQ